MKKISYPTWKRCNICDELFACHNKYQKNRNKTCSIECKGALISQRLTGKKKYTWDGVVSVEDAREIFFYDPTTGVLDWRCHTGIGRSANDLNMDGSGYIIFRLNGQSYLAHRLCWLIYYGSWPDGMIDHINRNKADNRIENLRVVQPHENTRNATIRSDNKSGFKGVCWDKGHRKWRASIRANGRSIFIGLFDDKTAAADAYDVAAVKFHGEYASPNSEIL